MVWALYAETTLHTRMVDGDIIAYQEESGDTHLFHPVTHELLHLLAQAPAEHSDIVSRLNNKFKLGSEDIDEQVTEVLLNLERCGIVERR